jgi:hypothetical protein
MSTIVTRSGKGSPLTHTEVDNNFTNLNADKTENASAAITGGSINNTVIGNVTPNAGTFTTLTATTAGTTTAKIWSNTNTSPIADLELQRGTNATWGGDAFTDYRIRATGGNFVLQSQNNSTSVLDIFTADEANNALRFSPVGVEQMRVTRTASAVNFVQVTGAATGGAVAVTAQGSDTNVQLTLQSKGAGTVNLIDGSNSTGLRVTRATAGGDTFLDVQRNVGLVELKAASGVTNGAFLVQSKGTGAINLAPGSSGVNISNGGTVTAITLTAGGSGYTSVPSVAITAPTTAGGVQATATVAMAVFSTTITSGGTGYTVGNTLTVVGGTGTAATYTVAAVSGGVITSLTGTGAGTYTVLPTNPVSVTGGTGSGASLTLNWQVRSSTFTITNAGSGYVEQPTVTFSGGGGSGAAAYATVGSPTTIRSLGGSGNAAQSISFVTPSGESFRVATSTTGVTSANYLQAASGSTGNGVSLTSQGSDSNVWMSLATKGTGNFQFLTSSGTEQMRVAHTASAVNFVQVTGAATGQRVRVEAQGSDTNIDLRLGSKGSGGVYSHGFFVANANSFNNILIQGGVTGASPFIGASGGDTNIDLALTPKGTGLVRFGTRTASADAAITGYIEIKDSGGTTRRLAVIG